MKTGSYSKQSRRRGRQKLEVNAQLYKSDGSPGLSIKLDPEQLGWQTATGPGAACIQFASIDDHTIAMRKNDPDQTGRILTASKAELQAFFASAHQAGLIDIGQLVRPQA